MAQSLARSSSPAPEPSLRGLVQAWDVRARIEPLAQYIATLVHATRHPEPYSTRLREWIHWGASPRAALAIERGARALAWLDGRDFVSAEDVQGIAPDALRHRRLLDYAAQARGVSAQGCVEELLERVPAP